MSNTHDFTIARLLYELYMNMTQIEELADVEGVGE
jgi:hypothetical protein